MDRDNLVNVHPSFDKNKSRLLRIEGITGTWKLKYEIGKESISATLTIPQKHEIFVKDFLQFDGTITPENVTLEDFKSWSRDAIYDLEHRELLQGKTFEIQEGYHDAEQGIVYRAVPGCELVI